MEKYPKGGAAMYAAAIVSTLAAWGVGLLLDANIDFGDAAGDQRAEGQRGQMNPRPEAAI